MENRYHILHIDDDVYIRKIIQLTMSAEFDISSCTNGIEAMAWLEKGNLPDIILTDLRMPQLDGQELIALIRNSSIYRTVPIIVLSSMEDSSLKITCIEQGADDFIVKPFNPLEVKAKIKAILRRTSERQNFRSNFDSTRLSPLR
ncbi:response regulator transcription factor [Spirosoma pollinicola]|uniref:Two-component system response regulator n=1 Tax=Spirosoma pollinicola TaxID=2057025 RepID=A0A2K8Z7C9_9BACT|nr:response regulator [Spirosoma pollinicola]AUD05744.1 two-component system response regulator [Spirosoma pollinicola]